MVKMFALNYDTGERSGCNKYWAMSSWLVKGALVTALALVVRETLWQTAAVESQQEHQVEGAMIRSAIPDNFGTKVYFRPPAHASKIMSLSDMNDLDESVFANATAQNLTSWQEAIQGKERVVEVLFRAGVKVDLEVLRVLPTWETIQSLYYKHGQGPVVLGMEQCAAFREAHPPASRYFGVAGNHNCGTNALSSYLMQNLLIPQNHGVGQGALANVPWHKHGWVSMRSNYMFSKPDNHEAVLPIVIVRDPYFWFHSMCESPYLMKWPHSRKHCPNLVLDPNEDTGVEVWTKWGKIFERTYESLAHVWSEFNGEYHRASFPHLIIRFEDLLFYTPEVLEKIRTCVDARWRRRYFVFHPAAMKQSKYFTDIKPQSSMLSAIIKYGQDFGRRLTNMTEADIAYAHKHLDAELMEALGYQHPKQRNQT